MLSCRVNEMTKTEVKEGARNLSRVKPLIYDRLISDLLRRTRPVEPSIFLSVSVMPAVTALVPQQCHNHCHLSAHLCCRL